MSDDRHADADLARRVVSGDQSAFDSVFRKYEGGVRSMATRVVREPALAEDIVQETFVGFWQSPHKFDPARGSLQSFLVTIAHRRAVDLVRSEVSRTRRELRPPDPSHIDVVEEVLSKEVSAEVRKAVASLAPGERDAITLAHFGGLSYVETARRLGEPEGTVKSRIRSGMRKLAVALSAEPS